MDEQLFVSETFSLLSRKISHQNHIDTAFSRSVMLYVIVIVLQMSVVQL